MSSKPRADEEYESDGPVEALSGSVTPATESPVGDMLLQLISGVAALAVQLSEADQEECRAARSRLGVLQQMVVSLPTAPGRSGRRIGFRMPQLPGTRKTRRK